jgi:phage gp36-like protein
LIQLTDDLKTGAINQAIVDDAISDAFAEAWPYVAVKYKVPIVPTPDAVKIAVVSIAIYNLYSRKVEEIPPTRKANRDGAVSMLKDIARGLITLGIDPAPAQPSVGYSESNTPSANRKFTKDTLKGF